MKTTITLYIKPKQTQNWNQIEESQETKNPIKIALPKKGKKKIQTNVKWGWEKHYISTKTNPELKPNRRIPRNQKSNKNCIQKREKENLVTKISWFFFTTDLTTKEEEENVEIFKEKKKLKSKATHSHKPTKFHEDKLTN